MKIKDKMKILREQQGLTQEDLARISGVSIQSIRRYESKDDANITLDILGKIASALNSNVVYFVSQMSPNQIFLSPNVEKVSPNPPNPISIAIPVYDEVFASAGAGRLNDECISFYLHFEKAFLKSYFKLTNTEHLALLRLEGDSMMPTLPPNARLLVQASTQFKEGQIVLCRLDDELFVKRLQKQPELKLLSDNKAYEPIALVGKDYELLSVVVGFVKALNWFKRYLNTFKGVCKFF